MKTWCVENVYLLTDHTNRTREMELRFAKFSGTGNDFILVDNRAGQVAAADMPDLARRCCRRGRSVGAGRHDLYSRP